MTGPSSPPGWYPAEPGFVRWWDGERWGTPIPESEAMLEEAGAAAPRRDAPAVRLPPDDPLGPRPAPLLPGAVPGDNTRTLVLLSHLGFVLGAFIMPLTVYLVEKHRPFVRHHAAEALNFQLTVLLVALVSVPLMVVYVGFVTLLVAVVADVALGLYGASRAVRGVWWRYPVNLRFVRP